MPIAHIALAAALAAPVLGTPLPDTDGTGVQATGPTTLRDPATLAPLPGLTKLPAFSAVDLSPNGKRVATGDRHKLTVRVLRGGRRVVSLRTPKLIRAMVWTKGNRLITVQCGRRLRGCAVRTYNPAGGKLVRSAAIPTGVISFYDRAPLDKVGSRFVLWAHGVTGPTRGVVLDREGRIRRTVKAGYTDYFVGRVWATSKGIYSFDPRTGKQVFRAAPEGAHSMSLPIGQTGSGDVWITDGEDGLILVDGKTLETKETIDRVEGQTIVTPNGLLVVSDKNTLQFYANDTTLRWEVPESEFFFGVIGDYVYSQDAENLVSDNPEWRVVIRSLETGETVGEREGRLRLVTTGSRAALHLDTGMDGGLVDQGP